MRENDLLALLDNIEKQDIGVWLDGGWGVDALLGQQTRSHGDVDLVVEERDLQKLESLLITLTYKRISTDDEKPWNFVMRDSLGHDVDIHVIVLDSNGNGIYGLVENDAEYPAQALTGEGKIGTKTVRCISAEYQLVSHAGYDLREIDYQDVKNLSEKFNLEAPG